ncbi:cyclophilin-like fold protein [Pontibacter flavimaris]|nr:cyclophilin-like fold protein [Pontibacter flavimaris]
MRPIYLLPLMLVSFSLFARSGCKEENNKSAKLMEESTKLKITVGSSIFAATLYNNASATAFKAQLPMTIEMSELNDNEKFFALPENLPTNASNPGTIQAGDIMLYGNSTLVLFYKSFPTSYNYTRLGKIANPSGLAAALGSGGVTVTFEID